MEFLGKVVSKKMEKTALVEVGRVVTHPVYKKRTKRVKKYKVHDEIGTNVGDTVKFVNTKPISKEKHFIIKEVVK